MHVLLITAKGMHIPKIKARLFVLGLVLGGTEPPLGAT